MWINHMNYSDEDFTCAKEKVIMIIKYITTENVGSDDLEVTWKGRDAGFVKKEHHRNSCQGQTRMKNAIY